MSAYRTTCARLTCPPAILTIPPPRIADQRCPLRGAHERRTRTRRPASVGRSGRRPAQTAKDWRTSPLASAPPPSPPSQRWANGSPGRAYSIFGRGSCCRLSGLGNGWHGGRDEVCVDLACMHGGEQQLTARLVVGTGLARLGPCPLRGLLRWAPSLCCPCLDALVDMWCDLLPRHLDGWAASPPPTPALPPPPLLSLLLLDRLAGYVVGWVQRLDKWCVADEVCDAPPGR